MPEDEYWLQSIVILANIIGFVYNLPQVILTIRTKKTDDISGTFLILRFISSILWIIYCSYTNSIYVLISWIVTCSSNIIIMYYKFLYKNNTTEPSEQEV
jgi:MtN3 and saliva related transmembrane protein